MAKYTTSITADGTNEICTVHKPRDLDAWVATLHAFGTFGGGTLSYQISTDGGTTKTTMKDLTGVAYSTTTADAINVELGVGDNIKIYAVLSGATNPAITVHVADNTGGGA